MDVWFSWARNKVSACYWCEKPIERKEAMVTTKMWRRGDADSRKWNIINHYHPKCYLEQGMHYLNTHPFTEANVGHKKGRPFTAGISDEQRARRIKLLKKKASIDQRRKHIKGDFAQRVAREALLDVEVANVMAEISLLGGVPASWMKEVADRQGN